MQILGSVGRSVDGRSQVIIPSTLTRMHRLPSSALDSWVETIRSRSSFFHLYARLGSFSLVVLVTRTVLCGFLRPYPSGHRIIPHRTAPHRAVPWPYHISYLIMCACVWVWERWVRETVAHEMR